MLNNASYQQLKENMEQGAPETGWEDSSQKRQPILIGRLQCFFIILQN
jgi:hypothetical protein